MRVHGQGSHRLHMQKRYPTADFHLLALWAQGFCWVAKTIRHREIVILRKKLQMQWARRVLSFLYELQSIAFICFLNSLSCWPASSAFHKRSLSVSELARAVRQLSTQSWGGIWPQQPTVQLRRSLILTCIKYSSSKQSTQGSATSIGRTSLEISQHFISIIFSWKRIIL